MATSFTDVLTSEDIQYLNQLPEVLAAKARLDSNTTGVVYFNVPVTETIRTALRTRLGLNLAHLATIPMRWIKGDTAPHVDVGPTRFDNTYLMYLNDSPGELVVDDVAYPIAENTAFVFNEGLTHRTIHTANTARLLLGPMNELGAPVGGNSTNYFLTRSDALAYTNPIATSGSYIVDTYNGISQWAIAIILVDGSIGDTTQASDINGIYRTGDQLIASYDDSGTTRSFNYYLYPFFPCFLEGTTILCLVDGDEKYIPVETMRPGTLVKTISSGYKKIELIGKSNIHNPGNSERTEQRLYKCSPANYPELTSDLYITGCHSILVDSITDVQRKKTVKQSGRVFVTDRKYRLMAWVDERAEPWTAEGDYTIWHFALEHPEERMNYGVYANGGLIVETCCIRTLRDKSGMTFMSS